MILALTTGFLFRRKTMKTDFFECVFIWKWGRAAEVRFDSNKDGLEDSRALYGRWATNFSNHDFPDEIYEDSTLRMGRFDVHALLDRGDANLFERDLDGDGQFEQRTIGDEAREAYKAYRRDQQATLARLRNLRP